MTGQAVEAGRSSSRDRAIKFLRGSQSVFVTFVASRLLIIAVILLARAIVVPGEFGHARDWLSVFALWDGRWYINIAQEGYSYQPGAQSNLAFFPLYPLLVRLAMFLFRDALLSSLIVSNFSFLVAMLLFHALVRREFEDARVAHRAVVFLAFSPVSFYFSCAYTESTFLMLALGAFLAARRQRWLIACLCGALLSATRSIGFLIVIPLLVEFAMQNARSGAELKKLIQPRALLFALIPFGLGAYMLFCHLRFDDPLIFMRVHKAWDRNFMAPWYTIANTHYFSVFYRWLFGGTLAVALMLWFSSFWLRVRPSYIVMAGVFIGFNLCWQSLEGIPRFLSVIFPLFLVLGITTTRFKTAYEPLLACSVGLLTICTILFCAGYWMT